MSSIKTLNAVVINRYIQISRENQRTSESPVAFIPQFYFTAIIKYSPLLKLNTPLFLIVADEGIPSDTKSQRRNADKHALNQIFKTTAYITKARNTDMERRRKNLYFKYVFSEALTYFRLVFVVVTCSVSVGNKRKISDAQEGRF